MKYADFLKETPVAHRGLHSDGIPENSVAAFLRAVEKGYAIETDVHLSKDGVPVVFHHGSSMVYVLSNPPTSPHAAKDAHIIMPNKNVVKR